MARRMVVFPHPDGPTSAVTRCRARLSVTSRTTRWDPKVTLTFSRATAASSGAAAVGTAVATGVESGAAGGVPIVMTSPSLAVQASGHKPGHEAQNEHEDEEDEGRPQAICCWAGNGAVPSP